MALGSDFASVTDARFVAKHRAQCHCGGVRFEYRADPLDAKLCHCRDCQRLHGAPMQWAAIFHKRDVRCVAGAAQLRFYGSVHGGSAHGQAQGQLPCKVSCGRCGTPLADEGRNMWLAFPTLFDFGTPAVVPDAFRPTCHIFYHQRVLDVDDDLPKWAGHKNQSPRL